MAEKLFFLFGDFNLILSYAIALIAGAAAVFYAVRYFIKSVKERGWGQAALLFVVLIFVFTLVVGGFLGLAYGIAQTGYVSFSTVIWAEIYLAVFVYYKTRPQAEGRGLFFSLLHLAVLTAGWAADRWAGMLLYSAPLIFIFHHVVRKIALVVAPAALPEDKAEQKRRRRVFFSYVFGMQMPLWNAAKAGDRAPEKCIDGAPVLQDFAPFQGLIKTHPNQVVALANGINFRAEGPGLIFTQKGDQPFETIDLRTQNRSSTIRAFSSEGIPFLAKVSVSFKIDDDKPDANLKGLFPYSSAKVRSALYLRSKREKPDGEIEYWDDHVLSLAEEAAREILAERPLMELWSLDNPLADDFEKIAKQMDERLRQPLLEKGVRLLSAKAAPDFSSVEDLTEKERQILNRIMRQQMNAWRREQQRQMSNTERQAQIQAEKAELEAQVQAYSALLTAIAEGVQITQKRNAQIVRNIILLRYVSVLEKIINEHPQREEKDELPERRARLIAKPKDDRDSEDRRG